MTQELQEIVVRLSEFIIYDNNTNGDNINSNYNDDNNNNDNDNGITHGKNKSINNGNINFCNG